jgi:serine protease Do
MITLTVMVKLIFTIASILLFQITSMSQSISPERVNKIKSATVRVSIEGSTSVGTGFFSGPDGTMLSCWHVIEPALIYDSTSKVIGVRKIFAELNTGEIIQFIIADIISKINKEAIAYDFCILIPALKTTKEFPYLKLGNYNNLQEGQEIVTCGYPLGMKQQFLSKGMVSTKYLDNIQLNFFGEEYKFSRNLALLDLTMTRGNSGGAIIKLGSSIEEDEVIGLADYIINPIAAHADNLIKELNDSRKNGFITLNNIDPNALFLLFTEVLQSTSIGISGCVSINHIRDTYNTANKK